MGSHSQITNTTSPTMSWQSYVDDQLLSTKVIKNAVIAGHDGNIWATSAGFNATVEELKTLLGRYASTDELAMKGTSGLHCIKTVQALIVCVYEEPVVPEQAATVTEKLGEYLISVGY